MMKCFTEAELAAYVAAQRPAPTPADIYQALMAQGIKTHGTYVNGTSYVLPGAQAIVRAVLSLWEQRG